MPKEPSYRNKGAGKTLVAGLLNKLKDSGILVVDLQCTPASSEPIWKRLGFIDFPEAPERYNLDPSEKHLYTVLCDQLPPNTAQVGPHTIEIWNNEPYITRNLRPTYSWRFDIDPSSLNLPVPIVFPAHCEWRFRWTNEGKVMYDEKIKRFDPEIDYSNYIVIKSLSI